MAKRLSSSQSNTLFNYFQSPSSKTGTPKTPKEEAIKKPKIVDSDSDDEIIRPSSKKRLMLCSDSDSENIESPKKAKSKRIKVNSPKPSTSKSALKQKKFNNSDSEDEEGAQKSTSDILKKFQFEKSDSTSNSTLGAEKFQSSLESARFGEKTWLHEKLPFLQPENIRDAKKRRPDHPDYDARTLYVPENYLSGLTPAMRQWWELKRDHFDSVLFFKVGKFYELYHMDAIVGVKYLGFSFMKGEFAHSGFPETAYGKMAASLIQQGFKVARIEQTETPEMMAERCRTSKIKLTKFDKVVKREICQISTKGTCIYGAQLQNANDTMSTYMMAICEKSNGQNKLYGVCFVDTSIGLFHLTQFEDDGYSSRLLAILAQHPPVLLLLEKSQTSTETTNLLKKYVSNVRKEMLAPKTQFLSASAVVEKLSTGCYFKDDNNEIQWPKIFDVLLNDGWSPNSDYELALRSFGACMWYLEDSLLDVQVVSMKKFELYQPIDTTKTDENMIRNYMVLDSITINNLNILGGDASLQKTLDYCCTAFGKRLFQQWVCRPLCNPEKIKERQKAVSELLNNPNILKTTRELLKKLPDLERQLSKIHHFGNKHCAEDHPDSRAVLYEAKTYSKRKVLDLLNTLQAFERCMEVPDIFKDCESRLLRKLTQFQPKGMFEDLSDILNFFKEAFDHEEAKKDGAILPVRGVEEEYDEAQDLIKEINNELDTYLQEQRDYFKCGVNYFGNDKKRYQLEIPEHKCDKVTDEYSLESTKKGSKPTRRYTTPRSKELLAKMLKAEIDRATVINNLNRKIFQKFSDKYERWDQVIQCLMILDSLCSLAEYARTCPEDLCIPEVLPFSEKPICNIENGRHPCLKKMNLVPNDSSFNESPILIITGPNMGGKSTYMRQVLLINIMAQIGSYVPASYCKVSMIDRIFTRLGAYDDIMKHKSTFLVELLEASVILKHATKHSFILMDEFGRGTSTHDGNAVATSFVKKLCEIKCRTLFSTHYHTLVEYFADQKEIQFGYMNCMVENEGHILKEHVVFLYKVVSGVCKNSYGFNVASLAGMPELILKRARGVAAYFESINVNHRLITKVLSGNLIEARQALRSLK